MNAVDRCYYKTATFDPESELPLYVLDLTYIPTNLLNASEDCQLNLQVFTDALISKIPQEKHVLAIFTNGLHQSTEKSTSKESATSDPSLPTSTTSTTSASIATTTTTMTTSATSISSSSSSSITTAAATTPAKLPINLIKIIKLIPTQSKDNLVKMFIVHGTWMLKSILDIFTKFYSFGTSIKQPTIIKCDNLTLFSHYIDITQIPISLHTYIIDKIYFKNQKIILNRHLPQLYGKPLTIYTLNSTVTNSNTSTLPLNQFQRIFNNLIAYLSRKELDVHLSYSDWQTIIKCSALSNETKIAIDILSDCLKREQLICLSDYSFLEHYMILIKFILKLSNSKSPLIPIELLFSYKVNYKDVHQVNMFLNKVLLYRHPLIDFDAPHHANLPRTPHAIDSYDNAYILIKIFKLFKYLSLKLQREASILEPNSKNIQKSMERQTLRLVLAFTKILYVDNSEDSLVSTSDEDDIGFDNLFKILRAVIEHYDELTILNTTHTIEDFNNHISFDDFIAFENFKVSQLGALDVVESQIIHTTKEVLPPSQKSPVKPATSSQNIMLPELPMPRKTHLFDIEGTSKSPSTTSLVSSDSKVLTAADSSIPVTKSQVEIISESLESLGIEEQPNDVAEEDMFKTPTRSNRGHKFNNSIASLTSAFTVHDLVGDLLTPETPIPQKTPARMIKHKTSTLSIHENIVPMVNNNLRKYTEKDLAVQQEVEKQKRAEQVKLEQAKEVEKGVRRGERKVSRLARLYEEKYMQ